jgi:carbonic anhydrase
MLPDNLLEGFERFQSQRFVEKHSKYQSLAINGQHPSAFVISCCDSRVSPEVIFDCDPGDIFVMRNIASIVPPFELSGQYHGTSAALDFAVRRLEVRDVIVLGHSQCGGVQASADDPDGEKNGEFIGPWLKLIGNNSNCCSADADRSGKLRRLELNCVENSLKNLLTFPWILSRCRENRLRLHGVHFDVGSGKLQVFDQGQDLWTVLNPVRRSCG